MYLLFVLAVSIKVTYRWVLLIYYVSYINWLAGIVYRTIKKNKANEAKARRSGTQPCSFLHSPYRRDKKREDKELLLLWSSLLLRKRSLTASLFWSLKKKESVFAMDQMFNKVGSYWLGQKANKQFDSVGDDINVRFHIFTSYLPPPL